MVTECINWTGCTNSQGYGQIQIDGVKWAAHRLVYTQTFGAIPDGLVVRHKCDNPLCVNPEHPELGTQRDNVMDCVTRGRHSRAKLTDEQVRAIRKDSRSSRKVGADYGIDHKGVLAIRNYKSYQHVED